MFLQIYLLTNLHPRTISSTNSILMMKSSTMMKGNGGVGDMGPIKSVQKVLLKWRKLSVFEEDTLS